MSQPRSSSGTPWTHGRVKRLQGRASGGREVTKGRESLVFPRKPPCAPHSPISDPGAAFAITRRFPRRSIGSGGMAGAIGHCDGAGAGVFPQRTLRWAE